MKTKDFLKKHDACIDGAKWALSIGEEMVDVWDAMIKQDRRDWLIWTATRPGVFPDAVLRKLACRFVRETPLSDGRKVWDLLTDECSKRAVEVAELYADGKATAQELEDAYSAAADAAARDAVRDAARDAAFAAARDAAYAVYTAAYAAGDAAYAAAVYFAYAAARAADAAARDAARDAADVAKVAQVRMIAELGNPFNRRSKTMSEAKHTPGPWNVDKDMIRAVDPITSIACICDVAWPLGNRQECPEANAHLIAAAPDLLEALEDCCVIAKPENPGCCCPNYQHLPDGDCAEAKNGDCHIWKAIQKARGAGMSDVIRRRADGSWGQGDDVPTYASDHTETWSGTRDKSMDHVSDEHAKQLAAQNERNTKEDIWKLHLQKERTDLLEENDALKNRIAELEREVQEYKEENVKLLQQCLALYRAVKRANVELDKIEESCDNNVWFQKIKERTY